MSKSEKIGIVFLAAAILSTTAPLVDAWICLLAGILFQIAIVKLFKSEDDQ